MNANATAIALRAANITVSYGRRRAVDDVTLEVPRGSVYALLGRNGAGKSSLVRCLLGQLRPERGHAELFGEDVWKHRARLMDRIGVVAEEADAPPEMTIAQIARFSAQLYSRWQQSAVDERLRRFGIPATSRFGSLSKGQKKQVALAMALATSPDLLILDDPTLGLDVVARKSLFEEVISELADRGITVFVTTHDLVPVESIADRAGILKDGRLVLDEELETLKSRFRRLRYANTPALLEAGTLNAAAVRQWGSGGTEAIVTNYDELAFERFRSAANVTAEVSTMSLEDIFLAVCGEERSES